MAQPTRTTANGQRLADAGNGQRDLQRLQPGQRWQPAGQPGQETTRRKASHGQQGSARLSRVSRVNKVSRAAVRLAGRPARRRLPERRQLRAAVPPAARPPAAAATPTAAGAVPANGWRGGANHFIEGDRGRLGNWNPPLPTNALRPADPAEFQRQAEAISRRLRELVNRMPAGSLPDADIDRLRQLSNRLRSAGGRDPMEGEYARMMGLVDQLELAALNASEKGRATTATRATRPAEDLPEYRETVAEYYRRLGGNGEANSK